MEKKKEEEKSHQKNHFAMAGIRTHKLCRQSQALYQLDNGILPRASRLHSVGHKKLVGGNTWQNCGRWHNFFESKL